MKNEAMKRNCLTCRHEPDWGKPTGIEYPRRTGACKWELSHALPPVPMVYHINRNHVVMYSDGSGLPVRCAAWESKNEG